MPKERNISEEDFKALLAWLSSAPDAAAERYETIRRSLIKIFLWRGFSDVESMADETIDRVTRNVKRIQSTFVGDPSVYFYNVANKLMLEYSRKKLIYVSLEDDAGKSFREQSVVADDEADSLEADYECLDRCLQKLEPDERALILSYYHEEKQAKIEHRKVLAQELNLDVNALRVRVYRIRTRLEKCIKHCLEQPKP